MEPKLARALVAILATIWVGGCGPRIEPFGEKTPQQLKQLTDVTDAVVRLANYEPGPERQAAAVAAVAAIAAADEQYRRHLDALSSKENAQVLACIGARSIDILDLETMMAKRDEALRLQDGKALKSRKFLLWSIAQDLGECAVMSNDLLAQRETRREALKHGAVAISQIYAVALTFRAADDLSLGALMRDQVRGYEDIAAKLGPEDTPPLVTDALPKLKAALSTLEKQQP